MTIYNVLINSKNRVVDTNTTSSSIYYFDWGIMEPGAYLLRWGFVSSSVDTTINKIALISVDLAQNNVYTASATQIRATNTTILGTAIPNESASSSFLYGDSNTNNIIQLNHVPSNNQFYVDIRACDGTLWVDSANNPMLEYVLALNFEKI